MHDQTAVRTEGIAEQFRLHPDVHAEVDSGYRGLAKEFPSQVSAPPKKPAQDAPDGDMRAWREARRRQSSARIVVEHTNAEYKQWHPLQRYTGRREDYEPSRSTVLRLTEMPKTSARRAPARPAKARPTSVKAARSCSVRWA